MSTDQKTFPGPQSLLDSLRSAADEVFSTMVSTVATLADSFGAGDRDAVDEHTVDIEAVVEFSGEGDRHGAVVLRCSMAGALDIARGLLMLPKDEVVDVEEIEDALRECANIISGCMKSKALDTIGRYSLAIPRIERYQNPASRRHRGTLVYRLVQGCVAIEIWTRETAGVDGA